MKLKYIVGLISLAILFMGGITGCNREPKTPWEAVQSEVSTDQYSVLFYRNLYRHDPAQYKFLREYCREHEHKPNCRNVLQAEEEEFNDDGEPSLLKNKR